MATLARSARVIVVAGLPGTGKSLVIHQLARLAGGLARPVHVLQWDVTRPVFEACEAGRRYPVADGVTQPMIRAAVGWWARRAVGAWARGTPDAGLLIVEAPLVGGRLIELARGLPDAVEPILAAPSCRFAVPVPTVEVRRVVEAERERRAITPRHPREREDAPPWVLRALWRELVDVARALGIGGLAADDAPYDPVVYRRVYETVLQGRRTDVVDLSTVLPTGEMSVYDLDPEPMALAPARDEAHAAVLEAERRHPDPDALARSMAAWWGP